MHHLVVSTELKKKKVTEKLSLNPISDYNKQNGDRKNFDEL